jgi:hypothetical protein
MGSGRYASERGIESGPLTERGTVIDRIKATRLLLLLYVCGSLVVAALVASGRIGNVDAIHLAGTTSGKILGLASLLSLGYGALKAAQDPRRGGALIQVLIVFTSLAALALLYRLFVEGHDHDVVTWLLLAPAVAAPILFVIFYPAEPTSPGNERPSSGLFGRHR